MSTQSESEYKTSEPKDPPSQWDDKWALRKHVRELPEETIRARLALIPFEMLLSMIMSEDETVEAVADPEFLAVIKEREAARQQAKKDEAKAKFLECAGLVIGTFADRIEVSASRSRGSPINSMYSSASSDESYYVECTFMLAVKLDGVTVIDMTRTFKRMVDPYGEEGGMVISRDQSRVHDSEIHALDTDVPSRREWIEAARAYFNTVADLYLDSDSDSDENPRPHKRSRLGTQDESEFESGTGSSGAETE